MPYLHWENETELRELRKTLQEMQGKNRANKRDEYDTGVFAEQAARRSDLNNTQKLLWTYLDDKHPLHRRRTLYEYHDHTLSDYDYHDIVDAEAPDKRKNMAVPMVDQLWMWILPKYGESPATVVTAFPESSSQNTDDKRGPQLLSDIVSKCQELPIKNSHDLAAVILSQCSSIFFDNVHVRDTSLQFEEYYATRIKDIVRFRAWPIGSSIANG
jgi:hypothetical protein